MTRRILIIDDEPDIREVVQTTLELLHGWQVLAAGSGRAGLTTAAAAQPEAILLDVVMPDLDGPATLDRLRADPATRQIPVIFLTARVQRDDRRWFAELGVAGVIDKPFDPLRLGEHVISALGWQP